MAEPVSFREANLTMAAPGAAADEIVSCSLVGHGPAGEMVSCWRPSFQELAEILRTGVIWVCIRGQVQPDLHVTGHKLEALGQG